VTEEEAKTKWCPFARTLGTLSVPVHGIETVVAHGSHNRGFAMDGPLTKCLCIASACMAWRWHGRFVREGLFMANHDGVLVAAEPEGFCGLAGAPQ